MTATDSILVVNAGSSSFKFSLHRRVAGRWQADVRGQVHQFGADLRLTARDAHGAVVVDRSLEGAEPTERAILLGIVEWLRAEGRAARLAGVGHRIVHGGAQHTRPVRITPAVLDDLRTLVPLAPLHQPRNLAGIEAVAESMPGAPQVACFDTSFFRGQPPLAELIPLPRDVCGADVLRYGFHGLSYEYIASALPERAPTIASGRVIVAHLGSGASVCALRQGRSVDNSFGFTALDGLCMATRPGALDPGVVLYLFQTLGLSADAVEDLLYRRSGLLGISGISGDMRELIGSADPRARLAVDYFVYRAVKEIGALVAVLGGLDGLVFTAGIGEHSAEIRRRICEGLAWLGIELDPDANGADGPRISRAESTVSTWVIPTDEESVIARHTGSVLDA